MAFSSQKSVTPPVTVAVDFPPLPQPPRLTNPTDQAAIAVCWSALAQWYEAHKTATLDKFNALASEINALKSKG